MAKPSSDGGQSAAAGRDPKTGRFRPGNRAGRGRQHGSRNTATVLLDKLLADEGEAILRATIATAMAGDASAQRALLDRLMPVRKGRPVPLALPEVTTAEGVLKALAEVVARMADGTLTPDEAATIASVVAAPKAILEVQEMDRRIVELERRAQLVEAKASSTTAEDEG